MSGIIEQPRHFCALGASQSVVAIERAVPIVHAGPGCGAKLWAGLSFCNGFQGSGYTGGAAVPSTNTGEKEVVFGGEERLRSVIDGALKVMDADLFVVLTGCTSDIVGDDTAGVVSEYRERGIPIIHAETGGFKGNTFVGHETLLNSFIDQFLKPGTIVPGLVNVFSSVPYLDPFWSGNLEMIRDLLAGIGLEANVLFGPGSGGVDAWRRVSSAQFTIVVSPWVGMSAAERIREKFGIPYLHYPVLPIGAGETSRFLREVSEFTGTDSEQTEGFIKKEERRFYSYLERAADFLLEFRYDLPGRFVTVCDSLYGLGISRFLVNDLGLLPGEQFVTDDPPPEHRERILQLFGSLAPAVSAPVTFTADGGAVRQRLRETRHRQPPLIIGSTWDKEIAADLKGYQLSLSLPVTDRLILDRSYVGYGGGLRLAEDIYAAILGSYQ